MQPPYPPDPTLDPPRPRSALNLYVNSDIPSRHRILQALLHSKMRQTNEMVTKCHDIPNFDPYGSNRKRIVRTRDRVKVDPYTSNMWPMRPCDPMRFRRSKITKCVEHDTSCHNHVSAPPDPPSEQRDDLPTEECFAPSGRPRLAHGAAEHAFATRNSKQIM